MRLEMQRGWIRWLVMVTEQDDVRRACVGGMRPWLIVPEGSRRRRVRRGATGRESRSAVRSVSHALTLISLTQRRLPLRCCHTCCRARCDVYSWSFFTQTHPPLVYVAISAPPDMQRLLPQCVRIGFDWDPGSLQHVFIEFSISHVCACRLE